MPPALSAVHVSGVCLMLAMCATIESNQIGLIVSAQLQLVMLSVLEPLELYALVHMFINI